MDLEAVQRLVKQHYRLKREVTEQEVRAEVRSLLRQKLEGNGLDDRNEYLWAVINKYVSIGGEA